MDFHIEKWDEPRFHFVLDWLRPDTNLVFGRFGPRVLSSARSIKSKVESKLMDIVEIASACAFHSPKFELSNH